MARFLSVSVVFLKIFCLSISKYKLYNLNEQILACVFFKYQMIHVKTDDDSPKLPLQP